MTFYACYKFDMDRLYDAYIGTNTCGSKSREETWRRVCRIYSRGTGKTKSSHVSVVLDTCNMSANLQYGVEWSDDFAYMMYYRWNSTELSSLLLSDIHNRTGFGNSLSIQNGSLEAVIGSETRPLLLDDTADIRCNLGALPMTIDIKQAYISGYWVRSPVYSPSMIELIQALQGSVYITDSLDKVDAFTDCAWSYSKHKFMEML